MLLGNTVLTDLFKRMKNGEKTFVPSLITKQQPLSTQIANAIMKISSAKGIVLSSSQLGKLCATTLSAKPDAFHP